MGLAQDSGDTSAQLLTSPPSRMDLQNSLGGHRWLPQLEPHPAATTSFLACAGLRDTSAQGRDSTELFLSDVKQGWHCALLVLIPAWDGHRNPSAIPATWESKELGLQKTLGCLV